jgi:ABC-type transporter Mla subunit MlaD
MSVDVVVLLSFVTFVICLIVLIMFVLWASPYDGRGQRKDQNYKL